MLNFSEENLQSFPCILLAFHQNSTKGDWIIKEIKRFASTFLKEFLDSGTDEIPGHEQHFVSFVGGDKNVGCVFGGIGESFPLVSGQVVWDDDVLAEVFQFLVVE